MSSNTLSEIFSLTKVTIDDQLPVEAETGGEQRLPEDFNLARSNIVSLIDFAHKNVQDLYGLATQSQNPRFFEALNTALKSAIDANKTLIDVHETVRRTAVIKQPNQGPQTVHNNLYITTADLQEMILQAKENNVEQIEYTANT